MLDLDAIDSHLLPTVAASKLVFLITLPIEPVMIPHSSILMWKETPSFSELVSSLVTINVAVPRVPLKADIRPGLEPKETFLAPRDNFIFL